MSSGARTSVCSRKGSIIWLRTSGLLCEPSSVATPPGLEDTNAHVPPGDFLAQGLGEAPHAELGEAVHAVAVPGDAASDRADVDDVGDPARALFGGLQQVREGGPGGGEQALDVDGDHAVPLLGVGADDGAQ